MKKLPRNYYSPRLRKVVVAADATLYVRFHEEAHREQHETAPVFFWLCIYASLLPRVGHYINILFELDADRRARRIMRKLGLWTSDADRQSRENLMSYFNRKEIPQWQALSQPS
jgi:hypothetical protein